jgi:hypothetical protein
MLSIMHVLAKWRQYLLGRKFSIRIDHNILQYLLRQKTLTTEQQKWMEKLSTFDMEIIHKKGKDNVVVDALSRKDEEVSSYATTIVIPYWLDEI